ncbi:MULTISPECIES: hypothetical protein [Streptomyces]|uniref:hypothetical protein n=1 Tax=Streptomyces TaxID=1883 RepID=UPI0006EBBA3E|nr:MULTISPECIES: hypothetical protein [Streptomyces]MCF3120960.1 hypothetical protein [Streptomyces arenae]
MDVRELAAALRAARVSDGYYWIEGVHEPTPTPTDFLYLRRIEDGEWEVGAYEQGTRHPFARHQDESVACAHLMSQLT